MAEFESGINKKIIEEMQNIGFNHIEAKILIYMLNNETGISKNIEHATRLRQPETSVGLKKLREKGFLKKEDMKLKGKGRPIHKYMLKKSKDEIRKQIIGVAEKRISEQKNHLDQLDKHLGEL